MEENTQNTTAEEVTAPEEQEKLPVKQQLLILSFIMLLIFGTGYVPKIFNALQTESKNNTANVPDHVQEQSQNKEETIDYFADLSIRAQSAYVWDVQEQRALYQKNPDEQLPLASVTKLMTALVAFELLDEASEIPITVSAIQQDGNSGLSDGESFTFKNLLDLTLLSSSNDGAFALASAAGALLEVNGNEQTFVEAMNIRAKELGLTQTYFRNPTGLDISRDEGGSYGSARDMTFLMEYILIHYPQILEQTQSQYASIRNEEGQSHTYENTNQAVDQIEGLIGSKTGYTELAGGNLAIAFDAGFNHPVVVVALGSSWEGRFADVLALSDAALKTIQR